MPTNNENNYSDFLNNWQNNSQYFGEVVIKKVQSSPNLSNGGNKETTTNSIMNDILRGSRK